MTQNKNIIIAVIVVLVVGFLLFNLTSKKSGLAGLETVDTGDLTVIDAEIVETLRRVQQITLDSSIFSNPVFNALQDFSREIVDEPVGKQNIFKRSNDINDIGNDNNADKNTDNE